MYLNVHDFAFCADAHIRAEEADAGGDDALHSSLL